MTSAKRSKGLLLPSLAVLTSLSIIALLIVVILVPIYLTSWGPISTEIRTIYTTGITILATLLTGFVSGQIQALLAHGFDTELKAAWDPGSSFAPLNRKWRAILRINSLREYLSSLQIHIPYLITGLITAAVVTGLAATPATRTYRHTQQLANGPSVYPENLKGLCTEVIPRRVVKHPDYEYMWTYPDGTNETVYLVQAAEGGCPTRDAQMLLGNINNLDPDVFAYADSGVAVHRSAIGAPLSLYSPRRLRAPDFSNIIDVYGTSAVRMTQCARVMTQNPIKCRPGGKIGYKKPWFNVTSIDGHCRQAQRYTDAMFDHYAQGEGAMIKGFCPGDAVGQGTIVFGAFAGYAHWLAQSINDVKHAPPTKNTSSYAITCTVDSRNVFAYRNLSLTLRDGNLDDIGSRHARLLRAVDDSTPDTLSGGGTCNGPPVDLSFIATAAAANWQIILQNAGLDGWFDLTWQAAGDGRPPPYAFDNSQNGLEDVLGLVAAMVTARINSTFLYDVTSTVEVTSVRVGSGRLENLAFLLPPLAATIFLVSLIARRLQSSVEEFDSTNLGDLLRFGWLHGERLREWSQPQGAAVADARAHVKGEGASGTDQEKTPLLDHLEMRPGKIAVMRDTGGSWTLSVKLEDDKFTDLTK